MTTPTQVLNQPNSDTNGHMVATAPTKAKKATKDRTAIPTNKESKIAKKATPAAPITAVNAQTQPTKSVKSTEEPKSSKTLDEPTVALVAAPAPPAGKEDPKIVRIRRYLDLRYEFRLDIVANEIEYRSKKAPEQNEPFLILNDNSLIVELYEAGFNGFESQFKALLRSDYVVPFDPLRAYFENLPPWDAKKPDYIGQLAGYIKARDQNWFLTQYKKMLVRTVACAIGATPFNKQCLVLVGKQNDGKSSFVRFHVPHALEKYYTEHIEFDNKDGKFALCENFIINLDELANFSKIDINKCKAFFTEDTIKIRRPFASRPTRDKRRASFFGSTNVSNFLTDETGNVRWLVMEINGLQHDNGGPAGYVQNVDINHVWAQAYALLQSGFAYQMSREEIEQSERHNKQHMQATPERELVMKHLQPAEPRAEGAEFMMAGEITHWLQKHYDYKIKINSNNMGKALRSLGFSITAGRRDDCTSPIQAYWVKLYA